MKSDPIPIPGRIETDIIVKNHFKGKVEEIRCHKNILISFFSYFNKVKKYNRLNNIIELDLGIPPTIFEKMYKFVTNQRAYCTCLDYINIFNSMEILLFDNESKKTLLKQKIRTSVFNSDKEELEELKEVIEKIIWSDISFKRNLLSSLDFLI